MSCRTLRRSAAVVSWLALVSCGPVEDVGAGADPQPPRVRTVGGLIGRFPPDGSDVGGPIIETARGLALGSDRFYVLDGMAGIVLGFDMDARLVGRIGRPGEGPGELSAPMSIAAGSNGGVWVSEPSAGTLSHFDEAGVLLAEFRTPYPPVNFAVDRTGFGIVPTLSARTLLARVSGDGATDLRMEAAEVPNELSNGPGDRLSLHGLRLAGLSDGSIAALRNRHGTDFKAWRIVMDRQEVRIVDVVPLPLPGWLYTILEEETESVRRTVPPEFAAGDFMVPFKGMHASGGRLWLTPSPSSRLLAVSVWPDDPVGVTGDADVTRGLVDAAVSGDRFIALYDTEVRVYRLGEIRERRPSQ